MKQTGSEEAHFLSQSNVTVYLFKIVSRSSTFDFWGCLRVQVHAGPAASTYICAETLPHYFTNEKQHVIPSFSFSVNVRIYSEGSDVIIADKLIRFLFIRILLQDAVVN